MTAELGQIALILALCLALSQTVFGLVGAHRGWANWMAVVRPATIGQAGFVALAFLLLVSAFLGNDFTVQYVAFNSNSELPTVYRVAAVWGAHEGSMLLWALILALWSLAVALLSRSLPNAFASRVLGVLGTISTGILLFILLTSNPFTRAMPAPFDGNDLNPLLQDPALAMHPPILYTGYVGFAVAFAFACAAMIEGKLDQAWARWTRPWTIVAWLFLTVGITLGSWWAYYELGWGGWWMWDPVENASFMPWLVGTALVHSLAVTERRGLFRSWTLLLAIFAFSLSLIGTFLVRSGIIVSVHAFASDPMRGVFILALLAAYILGALMLYAWRAGQLRSSSGFELWSRESFILFNNILLVIAAALIFIGTLYPLILALLKLGTITIGPPVFQLMFLIAIIPLIGLLAVGMHSSWKRARLAPVKTRLIAIAAVAAVLAAILLFTFGGRVRLIVFMGLFLAIATMFSAVSEPIARLRRGLSIPRGAVGMFVAHFGVGLFTLGATAASTYQVEKDVSIALGQSEKLAGYEFKLADLRMVEGPNYVARQADVIISDSQGRVITTLHPQKRIYRVQQQPMTEAGIDVNWQRDLFVALGDDLGDGKWSLRLQYKPLIRYLWLGSLIMALGGILAASDRRYRTAIAGERAAVGAATERA
ncbi:MAG TPA: heme lyase CcmF/NrfE family subunit [Steroidobacteraceae bacterium]|nr:heme lyase CcmF/NrfE family subunit [Steroidobacteraceae bacterium]